MTSNLKCVGGVWATNTNGISAEEGVRPLVGCWEKILFFFFILYSTYLLICEILSCHLLI